MKFLCLVLSHRIAICYNSHDVDKLFHDVAGCSRCGKVWVIEEKESEKS